MYLFDNIPYYFTLYLIGHIPAKIKIQCKIRYIYCLVHVFGWLLINTVVRQCMENAEYCDSKLQSWIMRPCNFAGG
jgi:hypothetical protein